MNITLRIEAYNRPGVLDRIAGLTRRKGWNINSLTAGDIDEQVSQINISISGKDVDVRDIGENLSDLHGVRCLEACSEETHVIREMLVLRLPEEDSITFQTMHDVRPLQTRDGMRFFEFTGAPHEVDALVQIAGRLGVSYVRSGALVAPTGEG